MKTQLILVGGFLGAGKTTLLWESARSLSAAGRRVGLITNDQADALVDTAFLAQSNSIVREVSGSCFCCNFPGLVQAIEKMRRDNHCDVIIAEPVGSCTDLSATIVQPLKDKFADQLAIAPLSVLADPQRLRQILAGGEAGLHKSAAYILRKQLEEADIILISKSDLLSDTELSALKQRAAETWPLAQVMAISAQSGAGLAEWWAEATRREQAGTHLTEIDYDIYAEGEAVLGWLNATYELSGDQIDWDELADRLLTALSLRFTRQGAAVAHVKLLLAADGQYLLGNLTGGPDTLMLRGRAGTSNQATLTINARVEIAPDELAALVQEEMTHACQEKINFKPTVFRCLQPGRPQPTFRYDHVVAPQH